MRKPRNSKVKQLSKGHTAVTVRTGKMAPSFSKERVHEYYILGRALSVRGANFCILPKNSFGVGQKAHLDMEKPK